MIRLAIYSLVLIGLVSSIYLDTVGPFLLSVLASACVEGLGRRTGDR